MLQYIVLQCVAFYFILAFQHILIFCNQKHRGGDKSFLYISKDFSFQCFVPVHLISPHGLHSTALLCNMHSAMHSNLFFCITFQCNILHYIPQYIPAHCFALHSNAFQHIVLHYIPMQHFTLHSNTFFCITFQCSNI